MARSFTITAHGKVMRVHLLDSPEAVSNKWRRLFGKPSAHEGVAEAFFVPPSHHHREKNLGSIYLPANHPRLLEFAIHESTHAAFAQATACMGAEVIDDSSEEHIVTLGAVIASRVVHKLKLLN